MKVFNAFFVSAGSKAGISHDALPADRLEPHFFNHFQAAPQNKRTFRASGGSDQTDSGTGFKRACLELVFRQQEFRLAIILFKFSAHLYNSILLSTHAS